VPKFFKRLPPAFEQFNPEAVTAYRLPYENTVDEQGLLHSFNDEPATVAYSATSQLVLTWYHHGQISRPNNKPCRIVCTKDFYSTLNANNEVHSYAGNPSSIRRSNSDSNFSFDWRENGELHREEDLPANIIWADGKILTVRYAKNGKGHRDNGRPAAISTYSKVWLTCGQLHNRHGFALDEKDNTTHASRLKYGLYGVKLQKETFKKVKAYHSAKEVPLWAAFLYELGLLTDDMMLSLKGNTSILDYSVPTSWKLRSLGVTNEKFKKAVADKYKGQDGFGFYRMEFPELMQLDALVNVVEYEEKMEEENEQGKRHS
jgi:hypothetical protein